MENRHPRKRKAGTTDEVKKPPAKKMKQGPVQLQVEQVPYLSQVRGMCVSCRCTMWHYRDQLKRDVCELQVHNVALQRSVEEGCV